MKFRKKPVTIEAHQWRGNNLDVILEFIDDGSATWNEDSDGIEIDTLEGQMLAQVGDWIIRGIQGEFYPCKPDIFVATYEPVEEA